VEGATAIAEALQSNRSIATLNMAGNKIGDKGAMQLASTLQVKYFEIGQNAQPPSHRRSMKR